MMSATPSMQETRNTPGAINGNYTTSSVEYYFDILLDSHVDKSKACSAAESFNKNSYYIDFDFFVGLLLSSDINKFN